MRSAKLRLHYRAYRTAGGFEGRTKDDAINRVDNGDGGGNDNGAALVQDDPDKGSGIGAAMDGAIQSPADQVGERARRRQRAVGGSNGRAPAQ